MPREFVETAVRHRKLVFRRVKSLQILAGLVQRTPSTHFSDCLEHGLGVSPDAIHFSDEHPARLTKQCLSYARVQIEPSWVSLDELT